MRQEAWTETKQVLFDYPKTEWYIDQVRDSILYPWKPSDVNSNISGSRADGDSKTVNSVVRLGDDVLINRLKFQQQMVDNRLESSPEWLRDMIHHMYFSPSRLKLSPASELVGVSYRTAKKYHEEFMEELADDLGILKF